MKKQDTEELYDLDDDISVFFTQIGELRSIQPRVSELDPSKAEEAASLFYNTARNVLIRCEENIAEPDNICTVSYSNYERFMSTLESNEVSSLAVIGSDYGHLEGWAGAEDKTVSEFIDDNCEQLAKMYSEAFPKHEVSRQKQLAKEAHKENEAARRESGGAYDHETAPNKYAHVREKAVSRVGKPLKYPSVPHQSQYGHKSLGVIRFAREMIYSTAEMDATEQVIFDQMLHYTDECGYVSIGYSQIVAERNISKSTAIRAKKKLISKGLIEEVYTGNGISKKTNRYRVTLSCTAGMDSEEFLAKRWYALTGKTDLNKRWKKSQEVAAARKG